MGVQLRFGTAGATGGGWSIQPGSLQPAFGEFRHEPRWSMQARAPKTWKDVNSWRSRWSFGCSLGGGTDSPEYAAFGINGLTTPDIFEPFSCDGPGSPQNRFIRGDCVDDSSNIVANAIIQAFRTSDDAFVGESVSYLDGTYICPVATVPGVQHYLVAYKPGSPDIAGTTVNTLTSTLVDGT